MLKRKTAEADLNIRDDRQDISAKLKREIIERHGFRQRRKISQDIGQALWLVIRDEGGLEDLHDRIRRALVTVSKVHRLEGCKKMRVP